MRDILIAIALIAGAAVLARYHIASQTYYPVARVSSPEGIAYLAVLEAAADAEACSAANERFLKPFRHSCEQCKVVYAHCTRELEGIEAQLHEGTLVAHPEVDAPGLRMAVLGEADAAQRTCDYIAADMVKRGIRSAACFSKKRPPPAR